MNNSPIITCTDLHKSFGDGTERRQILNAVSFTLHAGETLSISGSSGSGKTTLLHALGGLDTVDKGDIAVSGKSWQTMNSKQSAQWRNSMLGFIFQFHLLLPEFSALENAAMPLFIRGQQRAEALATAADNLKRLGLSDHAYKTPDKLSGGERQRVAVARALAGNPACLLADEPTGNLDRKNAEAVFDLMLSAAADLNAAVIVVSHDENLTSRTARHAALIDGKLETIT